MKTSFQNNRRTLLLTALLSTSPSALLADDGNLLEMIQTGGWAMWPLALCSIAAFYLIFWIANDLRPGRFLPRTPRRDLLSALSSEGVTAVAQRLSEDEGLISAELSGALQRGECGATGDRLADALSDAIERTSERFAARIHYLNIIASVAPMIGLLGTVSGMIGAFKTISGGGMGRAELLAGDIGEALITTASGLMVGIPAMIAYFILRNRLQALLTQAARLADDLRDTVDLNPAWTPPG
jgi:biopolymer transport protein ExbB